ncbi:error-prone DNA polymerase [Nitratireductor mangrovi]|uniref:Error-prone DNA polymerase n=1 Tax=Nitratireductor mangrovi TaxID=2599600 RepID=A0A5B8L2Q3_9HYPH|nr:error-prone DNA polymerase [Nitratireductor mangrovi]QDZ01828.1 error-prone DNA polymerase [Nitratireductor mangrovi]
MNTFPAPSYVEFAVQSNFSFLRGASRPEELVVAAKFLGHAAVGLADRNTVAGVVRAWSQSKHIKLSETAAPTRIDFYPGCRLVFADETPDMLAYPQDRQGWGHLCRLLTRANMRPDSEKGAPLVYRDDLFEWGRHISLAMIPRLAADATRELELLHRLRDRFEASVWLAVAPSYGGNDRFRIEQAASMAAKAGVPLMAINDVLYHASERRPLQDVMTAIRLNTTVAQAGFALVANAERHLKPPAEMARLFNRHPDALAETVRFAERLKFSLRELSHNYPEETSTPGVDPQVELRQLTWEGAVKRYPKGLPDGLADKIRHELAIVAQKNYARYFLTVRDIVEYAKSRQILCQGRGSAANSVICYCLGITEVDPTLTDLLFERFVSTERDEPPDIDVDFEHERRDEVIAYIYKKYSETRTALAASVVTYRGRSAMREVAKAMGLSEDVQSALSGSIWGWSASQLTDREAKAGGLAGNDAVTRHVMERANEIMGFPRHLSQHVGGFVITKDRLDEIVPIIKTAMDERKMVEWDKDDLDAIGLIKVDVLALGMLSCLRRAFKLLEQHYPEEKDDFGLPLTLATIPKEDSRVYDMICRADTLGVFQIESRAQMSMLPRLRPRAFYDLVIEVAIVRPGPIQGDMVHPYLRRREGKEPIVYPSPEMRRILERTKGVPLFQEQAMKIAIDAGGFTPSEADQLRRAMATFRRNGTIHNYREKLISGMVARGYEQEFAERCFRQIEGFGDYGFPESHAASFALLVYASCWFKTFYPDVFCAAILNSQPMGFYAPAQLVRDAREHGVDVRPADINASFWDSTLEEANFDPKQIASRHREMTGVIRAGHAVRLGFRRIKGLSEGDVQLLVERRGQGYDSVRDLWLRSGLPASVIARLAEADVFRSLGLDRRDALWAAKALDDKSAAERLPLFDRADAGLRDMEPDISLPPMPPGQHIFHDYRTLALSLKGHPAQFLRSRLDAESVLPAIRLPDVPNGRRVSVAGLTLVRQRPGKGNVIFMTLEDEGAIANIIVWPKVFERFRPIVLGARFVRVRGRLQSASGVIHIVAESLEDLSPRLSVLLQEDPSAPSPTAGRRRLASPADKLVPPNPAAANRELAEQTRQVMPKGRNFH